MYVLVWMYNEFLFFYKKEPYKQFIWRYIGQISPQISEKSSLGHFCHHFLYIKGNGKEGKYGAQNEAYKCPLFENVVNDLCFS